MFLVEGTVKYNRDKEDTGLVSLLDDCEDDVASQSVDYKYNVTQKLGIRRPWATVHQVVRSTSRATVLTDAPEGRE